MAPISNFVNNKQGNLKARANKTPRLILYYSTLLATSLYYYFQDKETQESPFNKADWSDLYFLNLLVVAVCGFLGDIPVLLWHATNPVHAKFKLNPRRKIFLGIHIASGSLEILCHFAAFFSPSPILWSYGACFMATFGHIPTSTLQMPHVFGTKVFTLPFYAIFIAMHIYATINLYHNPSSPEAILKQFVALHGYAWVRIAIWFFGITNTVENYSYTAAIWFAGFLTCPAVLGQAANFYFLVALGGFQALLAISHYLPPQFLHFFVGFGPAGIDPMTKIEFSRLATGVLPQSLIRAAVEIELLLEEATPLVPGDSTGLLTRQRTQRRRESLQSGLGFAFQEPTQLRRATSDVPPPPLLMRTSSYLDDGDDDSSRNQFLGGGRLGTLGKNATSSMKLDKNRLEALDENSAQAMSLLDDVCGRVHELNKTDRAKIVFNMFAGTNGEINLKVLAAVLIYWTVPIWDVQRLVEKHGNDEGCVDLKTWTDQLEDIYEFVIFQMASSKSHLYRLSRDQNLGTDKCPVHAIKNALSVPNAILLEKH